MLMSSRAAAAVFFLVHVIPIAFPVYCYYYYYYYYYY